MECFQSCFHTTGCEAYSFTTDGYGIFNLRTNLGAYHTQERESGTNRSAQELTRRDRKNVSHPPPPGDRTQGSSDLNFVSLIIIVIMNKFSIALFPIKTELNALNPKCTTDE